MSTRPGAYPGSSPIVANLPAPASTTAVNLPFSWAPEMPIHGKGAR